MKSWKDREPYAYWKGNPKVAEKRKELVKCNVSEEHDWNARIYEQVIGFLFFSILYLVSKIVVRDFNHNESTRFAA